MSTALEEITAKAARLPCEQRLALATMLVELDDPSTDDGVEKIWDAEIQERVQAVDRDRTIGIPYDQVLARVDRRLES